MGLPDFYTVKVTSKTVMPLVKDIVDFHKPNLENLLKTKLEPLTVAALDSNSFFCKCSKAKNVPMLSWPLTGEIKVHEAFFTSSQKTNESALLEEVFLQPHFVEYVTLHEMAHVAFGAQEHFQDQYLQLMFCEPAKYFTSLLEGFADALATHYLQKYYPKTKKEKATTRINGFSQQFMQQRQENIYFQSLYTTLKKQPIENFYEETEQFCDKLITIYLSLQKAEEEKNRKTKKHDASHFQLTLDF